MRAQCKRFPLHTRNTKRLDAVLVSADTWDSLGISGYEHIILSHAGDHKAVLLHVPDCMHTTTTPDTKSIGSAALWPSGLFLEFHKHMRQWAREHPEEGSPIQRQADIYAEIKLFVDSHPRPQQKVDEVEERRNMAVQRNPASTQAVKDLCKYQGRKRNGRAHKELRCFRRSAVNGGKQFFQTTKTWLLSPFQITSPQPTLNSAKRHLPCFAGNPPYETTQTTQLMQSVLRAQLGHNVVPPTWKAFLRALRHPKDKLAGREGFSPHLLSHLPQVLQWDVYQAVIHTWASGHVPQVWLQSRISLLYKKRPDAQCNKLPPHLSESLTVCNFSQINFERHTTTTGRLIVSTPIRQPQGTHPHQASHTSPHHFVHCR